MTLPCGCGIFKILLAQVFYDIINSNNYMCSKTLLPPFVLFFVLDDIF